MRQMSRIVQYSGQARLGPLGLDQIQCGVSQCSG